LDQRTVFAAFRGYGMAGPKSTAGAGSSHLGRSPRGDLSSLVPLQLPGTGCAHQPQDCPPQGRLTGPQDRWWRAGWAPAAASPAVPVVSCSSSLVCHPGLFVPVPFASQKKETNLSHPV